MKINVNFEFDMPDEKSYYNTYLRGFDWYRVASFMDDYLRSKIKYASDETPDEIIDERIKIRTKLNEIIFDCGVSLEDVE